MEPSTRRLDSKVQSASWEYPVVMSTSHEAIVLHTGSELRGYDVQCRWYRGEKEGERGETRKKRKKHTPLIMEKKRAKNCTFSQDKFWKENLTRIGEHKKYSAGWSMTFSHDLEYGLVSSRDMLAAYSWMHHTDCVVGSLGWAMASQARGTDCITKS